MTLRKPDLVAAVLRYVVPPALVVFSLVWLVQLATGQTPYVPVTTWPDDPARPARSRGPAAFPGAVAPQPAAPPAAEHTPLDRYWGATPQQLVLLGGGGWGLAAFLAVRQRSRTRQLAGYY